MQEGEKEGNVGEKTEVREGEEEAKGEKEASETGSGGKKEFPFVKSGFETLPIWTPFPVTHSQLLETAPSNFASLVVLLYECSVKTQGDVVDEASSPVLRGSGFALLRRLVFLASFEALEVVVLLVVVLLVVVIVVVDGKIVGTAKAFSLFKLSALLFS